MTRAIVRTPGPDFGRGITSNKTASHDYELMLRQHAAYIQALRGIGLEVTVLDSLPGCPDAYFVEDAAVVTPEIALIARPGAEERRSEVGSIEQALRLYRPVAHIEAPGTLDGGDVLTIHHDAFIGLSSRTNREGAEQLGSILRTHGYSWTTVTVGAGLHLKSGVNVIGEKALLITQAFAGCKAFRSYDQIVVSAGEEYAANSLLVNGTLLIPRGFPRICEELSRFGRPVIELDVSESRKMDGGLTCLSIRF